MVAICSSKTSVDFNGLHGVTSQKTGLFINIVAIASYHAIDILFSTASPESYYISTGVWRPTTHFHLVPRFRMRGANLSFLIMYVHSCTVYFFFFFYLYCRRKPCVRCILRRNHLIPLTLYVNLCTLLFPFKFRFIVGRRITSSPIFSCYAVALVRPDSLLGGGGGTK
jgi:hypothetical protein